MIYNGPLVSSDPADYQELLRRYRKALDHFCSENHVVTEFIRFHPLYQHSETVSLIEELIPSPIWSILIFTNSHLAARKEERKGHKSTAQKAARESASWKIVEPQ